MSRPSARGLAARVLVVALAVMSVNAFGSASSAEAATLTDRGAQSFAQIASCASGADHLLASLVVDASGSLRDTDPRNQRAGAVGVALDSLQQLEGSAGGHLRVDANLATFSNAFDELVPWGSVGGSHGERLRATATSQLPKRANGGTDYRAALRGAQRSLDSQARTLGGRTCKVLLWFTDGGLDVGAGTAAARTELCAPQGIVDGVRNDGIAIIALALFTQGGTSSVTGTDRDRLKAIAEGSGGVQRCGARPIPAGAAAGAYLRATDAGALGRLFAQASALISGGTAGRSVSCPSSSCVGGRLDVPVDQGVSAFRLVVQSASGSTGALTAPGGAKLSLAGRATTAKIGDATVAVRAHGALTTIDVGGFAGSTGTWRYLSAGTASVDLYYFWGARIRLSTPHPLLVGQQGTVHVSLVGRDGAALTLGDYADLRIIASVDGRELAAEPAPDGWNIQVNVPSSDVTPTLHLRVGASATTKPHSISLGPVTTAAQFATVFPPSFPTLQPNRLDLPSIVGAATTTGRVVLTGSDRGATQACFGAPALQAPPGAGSASLSTSKHCVAVGKGGRVAVNVTVRTAHPADGRVGGVLPVTLRSADGKTAVLRLPVAVPMSRPVDEPVRWGLILLFALLALGLAWGTAEFARRLSDRFLLGPDAKVASVPVEFSPSGVRRTDTDGRGVLFDPAEDFRSLQFDRRRKLTGFEAAGLRFRRFFPRYPLAGGSGVVEDPSGGLLAAIGGRELVSCEDASRAPADFPGSLGATVVVPSNGIPADGPIKGRLVMVVDSRSGVAAVLEDRIDQIRDAPWDRIVEVLVAGAAVRAKRAEASSKEPREGGRPKAESDRAPRKRQPEAAAEPVREPDGEKVGTPAMPSTPDWFDDSVPSRTASSSPPRSSESDRRSSKRQEPVRPVNRSGGPERDETSPAPTSPIDFWRD